jgi:hypothetical protein
VVALKILDERTLSAIMKPSDHRLFFMGNKIAMLFAYYFVVAGIAFWAISNHDKTRGRPFLSLIGAMFVPFILPLMAIIGGSFWAYNYLTQKTIFATDNGIKKLIETCSRSGSLETSLPWLRYARISNFAINHECSAEWFPDYDGMRFWVEINNLEYFVRVRTIDSQKGDKSGVSISVKL